MTEQEIFRAEIFVKIAEKRLSQAEAAKQLNLSDRQIRRLYRAYKSQGIQGLVSKNRGKRSNHRLPVVLISRVKELIGCDLYSGFGPTFMKEKLEVLHSIKISVETTRQLMIQEELWKPCSKKHPVIHQQRQRRARCGELLQIDGSPHAWFEDRGERCALLVFIDDATGRTFGRFFESENTNAYMITFKEYIIKYGKPLAAYSDKHAIFRVNKPGCIRKENLTQFGRAMQALGIQLICANSPQAKGRVERANQTLQDRLVKELRLAKINTIEAANRFLETYWNDHNEKFAVAPADKKDAHVPVGNVNLSRILCEKYQRKVTKNLEISFEDVIYQIVAEKNSWELRGAQITITRTMTGDLFFEYKGKALSFRKYAEQIANGREVNAKEIDRFLTRQRKPTKPARNHRWKQEARALSRRKAYQM